MFVLAWQFLKRFTLDPAFAASRLRTFLLAVSASSFFGADAIGDLFASYRAKRISRWVAILLGLIAAAVKAGEKNEDAHAIAAKLQAAGYQVTPPPPALDLGQPPAPPAA